MPSVVSEILRARAKPALDGLFTAYNLEFAKKEAWLQGISEQHPEIAGELDLALQESVNDLLHTIAGCILVAADNVLKACAIYYIGKPEQSRQHFGQKIAPGITIGLALQVGANAFRHGAEWEVGEPCRSPNDRVLTELGIAANQAAGLEILRRLEFTDADSLLNAVDAAYLEMEVAVPCETCAHPAADHDRENARTSRGCNYQVGIADGVSGQIAAYSAEIMTKAKTGEYRCECLSSREAIVEVWLKNEATRRRD